MAGGASLLIYNVLPQSLAESEDDTKELEVAP